MYNEEFAFIYTYKLAIARDPIRVEYVLRYPVGYRGVLSRESYHLYAEFNSHRFSSFGAHSM